MSKATSQKRPVKRDAGRFLLFLPNEALSIPYGVRSRSVCLQRGAFGLPTATGADTSTVVTGLFYGGGVSQLGTQALGSDVTVVATLVVSLVMMYALKYVGVLRVSKVGELEGLDLHEHGAVAYPDYALVDSLGHNGSHNGNHNGTPSLIPARIDHSKRLNPAFTYNCTGNPLRLPCCRGCSVSGLALLQVVTLLLSSSKRKKKYDIIPP